MKNYKEFKYTKVLGSSAKQAGVFEKLKVPELIDKVIQVFGPYIYIYCQCICLGISCNYFCVWANRGWKDIYDGGVPV